jgi:hypothetical protein
MKHLFLLLILTIFIFPSSVFASSHFSLKEHNFTVFFNENWRQFTEQDIEKFSTKDRENLISSFFTTDKNVYLYIKKYDSSHPFHTIILNSKKYYQETPKAVFKEERLFKSIEVIIGKKIIDFSYNFEEMNTFYETELVTSNNTKFKIYSFWKMQNEQLLEFQFVAYDNYKVNKEMIYLLTESMDFNFHSDSNTVIKEDSQKIYLDSSEQNKNVTNILEVLLTKKTIIILSGLLVIFFLISFALRFTNRN